MIRFAGSVKGKSRHPYIYAIVKKYCLYIGETQQHPVSRWGQHLMKFGSFSSRLKEIDADVWACDEEVLFMCPERNLI